MRTQYYGITYPTCLGWMPKLWHKLCCKKGWHLWDEVWTAGNPDWNHYLHCDVCGLSVEINAIEKEIRNGTTQC